MANVIIVTSTVCLILVGASAGSGSLRGTLKTANSSGLIANADVQKEDTVKLSWAPWPCPKKGPWPAPPLCGEGGVELQDLVNQSADVQKEDNVEFLNLRKESNLAWPMQDLVNQSAEEDTVELSWAPWPCPKKGPWPAPPLCGEGRIELQYDVNQSEFEQREDSVKSSWAPWPCPKKGPWPAPPLCGEGGVELQDLVNGSADVPKEDNVKLSWPCVTCGFKKAAAAAKKFGKKAVAAAKKAANKVVNGKACIDAKVKAGIPVGGKLCVR